MKTKKCKFILVESAEPIGLGSLCKDPSFGLGSIVMEYGEECFHIARANGKGSITTPWKRNLGGRLIHYELILISLDPEDIVEGSLVLAHGKYIKPVDKYKQRTSHNYESAEYAKFGCHQAIIALHHQISPQDVQKAIEQYNTNGEFEDVEIEMEDSSYEVDMEGVGGQEIGWMPEIKPKLTNNFITIVEKSFVIKCLDNLQQKHSKRLSEQPLYNSVDGKPLYTEDEVRELIKARAKEFSTNHEPFNSLLLKQDLDWFENNKKK